jgi:uncharacterized glyoxalase superfamily protein PhnB
MKAKWILAAVLSAAVAAHAGDAGVKRLAANLYVQDVSPCVAFWERLGFVKTMEVPDGPKLAFAQMKKGELEVMYGSYASLDREAAGMRKALRNSPAFLFVEVANLDEAIAATKGAEVVAAVHTTFYGSKEITVKDPGGNMVTFAQFGGPLSKGQAKEK